MLLSLGDLAQSFEDMDAGFYIAFLGCALLSILVCLGGMLGKGRSRCQMAAGMACLICFSLLFLGTKQVITINRSVWLEFSDLEALFDDRVMEAEAKTGGVDGPASTKIWEELLDEDHPRLERMYPRGGSLGVPAGYVVDSTGGLADFPFSDEMKRDIESAMLLRSIGRWGLLGVVLAALFSLWRKRGDESAATPQP